jgi:hypothetical protein
MAAKGHKGHKEESVQSAVSLATLFCSTPKEQVLENGESARRRRGERGKWESDIRRVTRERSVAEWLSLFSLSPLLPVFCGY